MLRLLVWLDDQHGPLDGWLWIVCILGVAALTVVIGMIVVTNRWPGQDNDAVPRNRLWCHECRRMVWVPAGQDDLTGHTHDDETRTE
jgi:hypothetical protein